MVPHCTYTTPEVASVGMNAEQLEAQNIQFETYEFDLNELDRSVANPQIKSDMPNHAAVYDSDHFLVRVGVVDALEAAH